jgi:hypothetical protein
MHADLRELREQLERQVDARDRAVVALKAALELPYDMASTPWVNTRACVERALSELEG